MRDIAYYMNAKTRKVGRLVRRQEGAIQVKYNDGSDVWIDEEDLDKQFFKLNTVEIDPELLMELGIES